MATTTGNQTGVTTNARQAARNEKKRFRETPLAASLFTGICSLLAILLGYWLSTLQVRLESYEVTIQASAYPFTTTNIQLSPGDEIEIRVLGADTTYLNCGVGRTSPMGMIDHQYQSSAIYPGASFCSFIGRIGDGPYFAIGAYYKSVSEVSGKLKLGVNDITLNNCGDKTSPETCIKDNTGELSIKVTVNRKK
jgi:hypothetical protein